MHKSSPSHSPLAVQISSLGFFGGVVKDAAQKLRDSSLRQKLQNRHNTPQHAHSAALDPSSNPSSKAPLTPSSEDSPSGIGTPTIHASSHTPSASQSPARYPLMDVFLEDLGLPIFDSFGPLSLLESQGRARYAPLPDVTRTANMPVDPVVNAPPSHINQAAKEWYDSCSLASIRLAHSAIDPVEEPIAIELTQSSPLAAWAHDHLETGVDKTVLFLTQNLRKTGFSDKILNYLTQFYKGPEALRELDIGSQGTESQGEETVLHGRRTQDKSNSTDPLADPLAHPGSNPHRADTPSKVATTAGSITPMAQGTIPADELGADPVQNTPHNLHSDPQKSPFRNSFIVLPALANMDHMAEAYQHRHRDDELLREATVLHETGHIEHWRRCPDLESRFGLHTLPDVANISLSLLALPVHLESLDVLKERFLAAQSSELDSVKKNLLATRFVQQELKGREWAQEFEEECLTIMQEGYADCFCALTLGCGGAPDTRLWAADLMAIRSDRIASVESQVDGSHSDYRHDSREALFILSERLKHDEGQLNLTRSSLHELCLSCASEGLCRWLTSVSLRSDDGPLARGFFAKCAQLSQIQAWGHLEPFDDLVERAENGPLASLMEPLNWGGARAAEIQKAQEKGILISSDEKPRIALSLAISLSESVGAPQHRLTGQRKNPQALHEHGCVPPFHPPCEIPEDLLPEPLMPPAPLQAKEHLSHRRFQQGSPGRKKSSLH